MPLHPRSRRELVQLDKTQRRVEGNFGREQEFADSIMPQLDMLTILPTQLELTGDLRTVTAMSR